MPILASLLMLCAADSLGERLEKLAPHAAGLALVEVTEMKEVDSRPSDGPLSLVVSFRILRSTGATMNEIAIVREWGGLQPPGAPPFKPHRPVKLETFQKGGHYWVAFCSQYDWERCPQGIVGVWSAKKAPKEFDEAVRSDHYADRPQYDPASGFTHRFREGKDGKSWTVRMERGGKLLWERELPGEKFKGERFDGEWHLFHRDASSSHLGHADKNPSGVFLFAETTYRLSSDNAFSLPPEKQRLTYALDADTGKTAAIWVTRMDLGPTSTPSVVQYFDLKTGARRREERYDLLETGGKAAGGKEERWYRKLERTYAGDGKRVVKDEAFRHGSTPEGSKYIPVVSK